MARAAQNKFETAYALRVRAEAIRAIADRLAEDDYRNFLRDLARDFEKQAEAAADRGRLKLDRDFALAREKISKRRCLDPRA